MSIRSITTGKFIHKYTCNEKYFSKNMSNEKYWLLGLIAADGNVSKNIFSISQSKSCGNELVNYIKNILNYTGKIYSYLPKLSNEFTYKLQISSKQIVQDLEQFNIIENKTKIFSLSNNIIDLKSFLRGYFEGDGSVGVYKNSNNVEFLIASFVGTNVFIEQLYNLIPIKISSKIKKTETLYELRFNGEKAVNFLLWLYSDNNLYKSYKYHIFNNYINSDKYKLKKIKKNRYNSIKITIFEKCKNGINPAQIVKDIQLIDNIPFQTIYRYIKQYETIT